MSPANDHEIDTTNPPQDVHTSVSEHIQDYHRKLAQHGGAKLKAVIQSKLGDPTRLHPQLGAWLEKLLHMHKNAATHIDFVEIILLLESWPTRLGRGRDWANFVKLAYQIIVAQNLSYFLPRISLLMVDGAFDIGDLEGGLRFALQALEQAKGQGDLVTLAISTTYAVSIYGLLESRSTGLALVEDVASWQMITPTSEPTARFYLGLAHYRASRNMGMTKEARFWSAYLKSMLNQDIDNYTKSFTQHELGLFEWHCGNFEAAYHYFTAYYKSFDDTQYIYKGIALSELGLLAMSRGRFEESAMYLQEAWEIAEFTSDHARILRIMNYRARLQVSRGYVEEAFGLNNEALEKAQRSQFLSEARRITGDQGVVRLAMGDLAGAERDLWFEYERLAADDHQKAIVQVSLSRIYRLTGRLSEAHQFALEALQIAQGKGYQLAYAVAYRALAECAESRQDAQRLYQQALAEAYGRQLLDEAACYLALANLETDPARRVTLWEQGSQLLTEIGCERWLQGYTPDSPPPIPLIA